MAMKIVVSDPKVGKTYQIETEAKTLLGLKLGEKFSGDSIGLPGYELEITGGSDKTGTPMRKDVQGARARRVLLTEGVGFHTDRNGERRKKRVFGNKIAPEITQINTKVITYGSKSLEELAGKKEEPKPEGEAKPEGAPVAEAKPEPAPAEEKAKVEEKKPEEPKEEAPAEEPKPEEKVEDKKPEEPQTEQKESGEKEVKE